MIAEAFYTQGTRLLDIRDPYHIQEVGWFNVADQTGTTTSDTWATYWHGDNYIYVADFTRGLDILPYVPASAGVPETKWLPALPLAGLIATAAAAISRRQRRRWQRTGTGA